MIGVFDFATDAILASVVGAVMSAVVAIIVAVIFGERAATNFSIKYRTKREHDKSLVGAPLDEITREVGGFEGAVSVSVNLFKDEVLQFSFLPPLEEGQRREMTEYDLLVTHLETGYSEIFSHLKEFREQYNGNTKDIVAISGDMCKWLKEPSILPSYSVKKSRQTEWCNYEQVVSTFVAEAFQEWKWEREITRRPTVQPVFEGSVSGNVTYHTVQWQNQLAHTADISIALRMRDRMDELVGSKFHDSLIAAFVQNRKLKEKYETIRNELQILGVKVNAGVPLQGYCSAGKEANPQFE